MTAGAPYATHQSASSRADRSRFLETRKGATLACINSSAPAGPDLDGHPRIVGGTALITNLAAPAAGQRFYRAVLR